SYGYTLPQGDLGVGTIQATITVDTNDNGFDDNDGGHSTAEANNSATTSVTSTLSAYPDLQVTGLAIAPASPQSGGAITVNWNDVNNGNAATSGNWYDHVVIKNTTTGVTLVDTTVTYDAAALGNLAASGGTKARSYNYTLPNGIPGVGTIQATITVDTN